ncbi:hypothetical protein AMATHDRAFT_70066 [Amanita thiersii Skay4041]|uniref:Uncharacterized protein n=1 Tax=Amanita thiersii Skay4041 TaxID=703135 RepID=A0A2A9N7H0_9AGAR|nr:hypothetical protein AMATHDRAFT_70066 [Amanita thiersii Skay4041]
MIRLMRHTTLECDSDHARVGAFRVGGRFLELTQEAKRGLYAIIKTSWSYGRRVA